MHMNHLKIISKCGGLVWRYRMRKYKIKLNMLEPGIKMIKVIGILAILSIVFHIVNTVLLCYIFSSLTVLLSITLWILLIIEDHQDMVLNEQAIQERGEDGEN